VPDGDAEAAPSKKFSVALIWPPLMRGGELASLEGRVAVRAHGKVPGLHLEHRLGEADVAGGDDREVVVVLLVDSVADVRSGRVEGSPPVTSTDSAISPISSWTSWRNVSGAQLDPGDHDLLRPAEADGDGIGAEDQRSAGVGAGMIGCEDAPMPVASFRTMTAAPGSAPLWASVTTPPMIPRSERWARREALDPRLRHRIISARVLARDRPSV
jgi:hypothetical protein